MICWFCEKQFDNVIEWHVMFECSQYHSFNEKNQRHGVRVMNAHL